MKVQDSVGKILLFISNTFVPLNLYLHAICQQRVAANKGATEPTGPSGEVESLTVDIMNLLTVTEYLCHKMTTDLFRLS
jgi:hypothetical protein